MPADIWFWLVYVLSILFGGWCYYPFGPDTRRYAGASLVIFVLIGLLGWRVFGAPLK